MFGGVIECKWSPDVAILLSEIGFKQILAMGVRAEISNIKLFLKDKSNNKFRRDFMSFKVQKEEADEMATGESKAKKFAEEIKKEIKEDKPSGLMEKETE